MILHVRTISTNETHPDAVSPILRRRSIFRIHSAHMQIVDDVVGVFCSVAGLNDISSRLVIWNWKNTSVCVVSALHWYLLVFDYAN